VSSAKALCCDRCGKRALCVDDKDGRYPSGWGGVTFEVVAPHCKTYLDLCDDCAPVVYNVINNKTHAMRVPNPIEVVLQLLVDATPKAT
jgi:hypothetical protein